jgi:hypothetical protein
LKLLLHCCCGPCATSVAEHFQGLGDQVTGWFFNPNIHPEEERTRRETTLAQAAEAAGLPLLPGGPAMRLVDYLLAIARRGGPRCHTCYALRLEATAKEASAKGFDGFSTTLLISPHQDLEAISSIGCSIAERTGIEFRFADLRGKYGESCERSRELDLYRQNYCGCLFSGLERSQRRSDRFLRKALAPADRLRQ